MATFVNLLRFEFDNAIRRKALWLSYLLLYGFYIAAGEPIQSVGAEQLWAYIAQNAYSYNVLLPIVGGILAADRMQRDMRLGLHELQCSTPLRWATYVLAKYLGVLSAVLVPVLAGLLLDTAVRVLWAGLSPYALVVMLVAFAAITVPAYAFIVAFSLACPLVLPIRVYQILFTGYWVWGNFLSPNVFPTLAGTLITPASIYALQGFFQTNILTNPLTHTAPDAVLNLAVLALTIAAALVLTERFLRHKAQGA